MSSREVAVTAAIAADSGVDAEEVLALLGRSAPDRSSPSRPIPSTDSQRRSIGRTRSHRLYAIKGRPAEKAIPVLIADPAHVCMLTPHLSASAARLAWTFWPGALTLVLPALPDLPRA